MKENTKQQECCLAVASFWGVGLQVFVCSSFTFYKLPIYRATYYWVSVYNTPTL